MKFMFLLSIFFYVLTANLQSSESIDFKTERYENTYSFSGNTNYLNDGSESLMTTITGEYKLNILTHKNFDVLLSGKVDHKYDFFGNVFLVDVFTTLEIAF